jgi:hypothetical protein
VPTQPAACGATSPPRSADDATPSRASSFLARSSSSASRILPAGSATRAPDLGAAEADVTDVEVTDAAPGPAIDLGTSSMCVPAEGSATDAAAPDRLDDSADSRPGPTTAHPISSSGPTASNAALPYCPASNGSATFRASVTTLAKTSSRRAGRSWAAAAPHSTTCRIPSNSPRIDRSTAGATSGATQTGTPRRSAKLDVAETEQERQPDDGTHDHGDGPHNSAVAVIIGTRHGQPSTIIHRRRPASQTRPPGPTIPRRSSHTENPTAGTRTSRNAARLPQCGPPQTSSPIPIRNWACCARSAAALAP